MNHFVISFALCFSIYSAAEEPSRGLLPTDFYNERSITSTALSPDGSLLAFGVMSIDESNNKWHHEIWMQELVRGVARGDAFRFTSSTVDATSPAWSPSGEVLSFQSKREGNDNTTWFIRVTAPGGEAYQIEGVEGSPAWSPDNQWIAFVKEAEASAQDEESKNAEIPKERKGWISDDAITDTLDAKRFDGRVFTTMRTKSDGVHTMLPNPDAKKKRQVFVVPAGGGKARQVTRLAFNAGAPIWTGDSNHLIISADAQENDEYNDEYTSDLFRISIEDGEAVALIQHPGSDLAPALSNDRTRLAWLHSAGQGEPTDVLTVAVLPDGTLASDWPVNLTANWDLDPGAPHVLKNGGRVRWTSQIGGDYHVFEADLEGTIQQITRGPRLLQAVSYDDAGRFMAYSSQEPQHPGDLFVAKSNGASEKQLTHLNDDWLEQIDLAPVERLTWAVDDGTEIEGWLMPPLHHAAGTKAPMILQIHGGPHSFFGNYWFREFHILSEAGFFVLYVNPRGSTGYGHNFTYATRKQWGLLDAEDFLKGIDAAIASHPDIDADRVGVAGVSYGGFMAAWLTSTTDRFAAASPSSMIANWESWYGTSDGPGLTEFEFGATPWEARELYRQLSPLSYVENVTAPTLIIHSEHDYRTPMQEAEQWYIALKKRQVPVEMVRYPHSSHALHYNGEPWLLVDRLQRIKTWFQHWLIEEKLTHQQAKERYGEQ